MNLNLGNKYNLIVVWSRENMFWSIIGLVVWVP
jgi:hypothetical protein